MVNKGGGATTKSTPIIDTDTRVLSVDFFREVVMFFLIAEATGLYELLVMPGFKDTFIHTVGKKVRISTIPATHPERRQPRVGAERRWASSMYLSGRFESRI